MGDWLGRFCACMSGGMEIFQCEVAQVCVVYHEGEFLQLYLFLVEFG